MRTRAGRWNWSAATWTSRRRTCWRRRTPWHRRTPRRESPGRSGASCWRPGSLAGLRAREAAHALPSLDLHLGDVKELGEGRSHLGHVRRLGVRLEGVVAGIDLEEHDLQRVL